MLAGNEFRTSVTLTE